jgi:hypothetical protein
MDEINLEEITRGYCGLTKEWGAFLLQGCIATLSRHDHPKDFQMELTGARRKTIRFKYRWKRRMRQIFRSWGNQKQATEFGAACIGILLALKFEQYEVIESSMIGSGIDYWIGFSDRKGILFQKKARLEVSGIFEGSQAELDNRFNEKCGQTRVSDDSGLPAFISVTEFSRPVSKFAQNV